MKNPNTLPSTHEVQSAIDKVSGTRAVLTEDLAQLSGKSVSALNHVVSRKVCLNR